jgi:hypothetical protein
MASLRTAPRFAPARSAFAAAVAEAALSEQYLAADQREIPQRVTSALSGSYPNAGRQATRTNRQEPAASPQTLLTTKG